MTRGSRQRDALAPTLFPFLAVLLCTMGALVLILMLIVSGAKTSKQQAAQETQLRVEEAETALELVKNKLSEQLSEEQIQLEKERLKLQGLESHINELLAELEELQQTAQLAEQELSEDQTTKEQMAAELSELEKKLAEATEAWKQQLDKPKGDKPVFAIIPYQGTNGTHRRPIYVECTAQGVIIQPEGVLVPLSDLQPPYGPGNPLDAALRAIRAEFPPTNGAVTSTAYPLLVVRPSGIQAYVMARAAMRGWDDQFGYELIDEELELAFPPNTPGLKSKIVSSIKLARERQAALVMAMPQRFREMELDESFNGQWRSDAEGGAGSDGTGGGNGGFELASGSGDSESGNRGAGDGDFSRMAARDSRAGNPGGEPGNHSGLSNGQRGSGLRSFGDASAAGGMSSGSSNPASTFTGGQLGLAAGTGEWGGADVNPNSAGQAGEMLAADRTSRGGQRSWGTGMNSSDPQGGGGELSWDTVGGQPAGTSQGSGSYASQQGASASSAGAATSQQMSDQSSGNSGVAGGSKPTAGTQSQMNADMAAAQGNPSMNPSDLRDPPSLNMNTQLNPSSSRESSAPIAKSRGRNWAWSQGPATETPVVRSIRMQCLADRWVVLPEAGSSKASVEILFDGSPRERAEKLADVIAERVNSWGIALVGGHWKPVLSVDVVQGAEWRFDQLRQLLAGSGLDVQQRGTISR